MFSSLAVSRDANSSVHSPPTLVKIGSNFRALLGARSTLEKKLMRECERHASTVKWLERSSFCLPFYYTIALFLWGLGCATMRFSDETYQLKNRQQLLKASVVAHAGHTSILLF
jgi:hypothetical protein